MHCNFDLFMSVVYAKIADQRSIGAREYISFNSPRLTLGMNEVTKVPVLFNSI